MHYCSCSGGKDSVATVILAHENNEPLDEIIFAEVMFSDNISGELPEHIDFVKNTLFPKFEEWGYKTKIVHSGITFVDMFFHLIKNSKMPEYNGKIAGFPVRKGCYMNSQGKVKAINDYVRTLPEPRFNYVGIATDEPERLERAKGKGQISLLEKYGYTEQDAFNLCEKYGLLSPTYQFSKRGGCWFCPNQNLAELRHLYFQHRELWDILSAMENLNGVYCKSDRTAMGNKYRLSDYAERFERECEQIKFTNI